MKKLSLFLILCSLVSLPLWAEEPLKEGSLNWLEQTYAKKKKRRKKPSKKEKRRKKPSKKKSKKAKTSNPTDMKVLSLNVDIDALFRRSLGTGSSSISSGLFLGPSVSWFYLNRPSFRSYLKFLASYAALRGNQLFRLTPGSETLLREVATLTTVGLGIGAHKRFGSWGLDSDLSYFLTPSGTLVFERSFQDIRLQPENLTIKMSHAAMWYTKLTYMVKDQIAVGASFNLGYGILRRTSIGDFDTIVNQSYLDFGGGLVFQFFM